MTLAGLDFTAWVIRAGAHHGTTLAIVSPHISASPQAALSLAVKNAPSSSKASGGKCPPAAARGAAATVGNGTVGDGYVLVVPQPYVLFSGNDVADIGEAIAQLFAVGTVQRDAPGQFVLRPQLFTEAMHRHVTVDVFGVEGDVGIGIWQVEVNIRIGSNVVVYWLLPNSVLVPTQITPFDNTIEFHLRGSGILPSKVHVLEGKDRRGYIYI